MSPARLATLLALMLLLPRLTTAQNAPTDLRANAITLPKNVDHVTIPLTRHFDVPTVAVSIAGQDAGRFLIDTGSPHTIVDAKLTGLLRQLVKQWSVASDANIEPEVTSLQAGCDVDQAIPPLRR